MNPNNFIGWRIDPEPMPRTESISAEELEALDRDIDRAQSRVFDAEREEARLRSLRFRLTGSTHR